MVTALVSVNRVSKYFGRRRVLCDVSMSVCAGERVVVLGENGSGKSTLLNIASGVLDADYGKVERTGAVGYVPEKPDIPDHLLVVEWLDVIASLKRTRFRESDDLGVGPLLGKRVAALSLGQRQRVSLCAAWMGEPELLVLDEPTNALDEDARGAVIERLRNATVLVATHDRELVRSLVARVVMLKDGRIVTTESRAETSFTAGS